MVTGASIACCLLICGGCGTAPSPAHAGAPATAFVTSSFTVYRYDDLDGDHRYESAGERRDFMSLDKLPGIYHTDGGLLALSPTQVLYADNGRLNETIMGVNAIYALQDLDDDGLAMSAGEVRTWFAGYDSQGVETPPIWTLTIGPDGVVYGLRDTGYFGGLPSEVVRFADGNADADVDDAGESTAVAMTTDLVRDFAIDPDGAIWYVEPEEKTLYRAVGGVREAVLSAADLSARSLRFNPYPYTMLDILDGAPVFSVVNERNPLGGTLATVRDGEVRVIWDGHVTTDLALQTLSSDFEVLPDRSVLSLRNDGDGYNGALHRLVDANADGDYLDFGEGSRVLDPRVLAANGAPQPSHTYSIAGVIE